MSSLLGYVSFCMIAGSFRVSLVIDSRDPWYLWKMSWHFYNKKVLLHEHKRRTTAYPIRNVCSPGWGREMGEGRRPGLDQHRGIPSPPLPSPPLPSLTSSSPTQPGPGQGVPNCPYLSPRPGPGHGVPHPW